MHDFQRVVARAHRDVYARQLRDDDVDDDDNETRTGRTSSSTKTRATATSMSSPASTTSSAATTPSTTAKAPTTTAVTTSTQAPLIDLSSILGFTSAIPIGRPTSSSSSSLPMTMTSSSITSSATSVSSSASRQLSTSTAMLTSSNTAAAASATESATAHSGLSGAETGGIVAGSIFAGLALLIYAVRKTFMQRRKRKRNSWGAGIYPDINDKYTDGGVDLPPPIPEKARSPSPMNGGYLEPRTPVWAPPRPLSLNAPAAAPPMQSFYVQPPQPSYNNAIMDAAPAVALMAPVPTSSFGIQSVPGEPATVKVLYIPTLPDELSITTGETVYIIKAYDDGWALCSNARGEQGVVPLECLDRNGQSQEANRLSVAAGQQESGGNNDWRNMKRMSSLSTQ